MTPITKAEVINIIKSCANDQVVTEDTKYYQVFSTIIDQVMMETTIASKLIGWKSTFMHSTLYSQVTIGEFAQEVTDQYNAMGEINWGKRLLVARIADHKTINDISKLFNMKSSRIKNIEKNKVKPTNSEKILINIYLNSPDVFDLRDTFLANDLDSLVSHCFG